MGDDNSRARYGAIPSPHRVPTIQSCADPLEFPQGRSQADAQQHLCSQEEAKFGRRIALWNSLCSAIVSLFVETKLVESYGASVVDKVLRNGTILDCVYPKTAIFSIFLSFFLFFFSVTVQ